MIGYCYSQKTGEYIGAMNLQLDPLESKKAKKDIYMYPPNTTLTEPPTFTEKQKVTYSDGEWAVKDIPEPEKQPEPKPPTEEELLIQQEEQMIYNETRKIAIERLGDKLTVVKK